MCTLCALLYRTPCTVYTVHSFRNLEGSGGLAREYVARSPKPYPLASMLSSVAMMTTVVLAQSAEVQCTVAQQRAGLQEARVLLRSGVFHLFQRQPKRCCALRSMPKNPCLKHCRWQACGKSDGTPQLQLRSLPVEGTTVAWYAPPQLAYTMA